MNILKRPLILLSIYISIFSSITIAKEVSTYWGDRYSTKSFASPSSEVELKDLISKNYSNSVKYRIVGSRHSDNDSIHSKEMMISLNSIPLSIKYDPINKTVTTSSWISLLEINKFLFKHNRVLQGTPSAGFQTLGGSLATGSHSEGEFPIISDSVTSMKVLLPNGKIRTITNHDELRFFNVSMGLLGTILEVELKTISLKSYQVITKYSKLMELTHKDLIDQSNESQRLLIDYFPYTDIIKTSSWKKSEIVKKEENNIPSFFDNLIYKLAIKVYKISKKYQISLFEDLLIYELNSRNYTTSEMISEYSSKILLNNFPSPSYGEDLLMKVLIDIPEKTKDFEIAVPLKKATETLKFISSELKKAKKEKNLYNPIPLLLRVGRSNQSSLLGMNSNQDTGFIIIPVLKDHEEFYSILAKQVINKYGGRPHIGKYLFDLNHKEIFKNYDQKDISKFFKFREAIDSKNLLINDYAKRLLP